MKRLDYISTTDILPGTPATVAATPYNVGPSHSFISAGPSSWFELKEGVREDQAAGALRRSGPGAGGRDRDLQEVLFPYLEAL